MTMQPILTIKNLAERLGVTDGTILTWIKTSDFPSGRRLGGPRSRRYWLESDLSAWLERPVTATKPAKSTKTAKTSPGAATAEPSLT